MKRFLNITTLISLSFLLLACSASSADIEAMYRDGQYEWAIKAINRRLFVHVNEIKSLHIRARCYEELGEVDKAQRDYNRILDIDPNYAQAYAAIGKILLEKGFYSDAELYILKAAKLEPEDFEIVYLTGRIQLMVKNWDRAELFLKQAEKMDPEFAPIYYYTGMARANRGDVYGAAASFNTYLNKEPDNLAARYNRGFALLKIGYLPWALEDFEFILKINPNHIEALARKGVCLALMDNPEGCQMIQDAANKGSDYAESHLEKFCL
ncbi:MAG TPA: tetratricopeptide repeat protein [Algoriphagus sp.]|nr:tetratricopeptide repeat protein [Algoriphagus sp.]